jgi:hypothetical protein
MLTRHLYEADEVAAALLWSIRRGKLDEVAFWSLELIDSEMIDDLYKTLYMAWLWLFGCAQLEYIRQLHLLFHRDQETTDRDIIELACGLARLPKEARDRSVLTLLLLGTTDKVAWDRTNECKKLTSFFEAYKPTKEERAFLRACYQGKTRLAWQLSIPLWQQDTRRTFELLRSLEMRTNGSAALCHCLEILEENECDLDWAVRACAVASSCLDSPRLLQSTYALNTQLPKEIETSLLEWKGLEGRKARRVFRIPTDCLYKITRRGELSTKVQTHKKGYVSNFESLKGTPFWNRVLEEHTPWASDDAKETFYEQYFPDDIPDEWSLDEQTKSHGLGVVQPGHHPTFDTFWRKWYSGLPCRALWLPNREFLALLSKEGNWESGWDALYKQISYESISLEPIGSRVFEIQTE